MPRAIIFPLVHSAIGNRGVANRINPPAPISLSLRTTPKASSGRCKQGHTQPLAFPLNYREQFPETSPLHIGLNVSTGSVEDTLSLLGHALRKAVGLAAQELDTSTPAVVAAAGLTLVGHSSLKAALDLD